MKTTIKMLALVAIFAIALTGCSKKNDASPSSSSSSNWTVAGTKYTAATTVFTNNSLLGVASSNRQITIGILFSSRPSAGTYTVVSDNVGSGKCSIQASGAGNAVYLSQGGGQVTVTVNRGKIQASFSGVPMVGVTGTAAGSISGSLTEQ